MHGSKEYTQITRLRRCPHGDAAASTSAIGDHIPHSSRVIPGRRNCDGRFVGAGAALVGVGPAWQEEEQPADGGESSDAEGECPPLLPALTLPRRRSPRNPVS